MFNYSSNNNTPFSQTNNSTNPFLSSTNNNIFNQNNNNNNNIFNNNTSNNVFYNNSNFNNNNNFNFNQNSNDNNSFLYNFRLNNNNVSVSLEINNSIGKVPTMTISNPNSIKKFPDSTRINGKEYDFVYAENLVFDNNYKDFCLDELKMAELQNKGMSFINSWKINNTNNNIFNFSNTNNGNMGNNNQNNNFLINNNNGNNPFFNNNSSNNLNNINNNNGNIFGINNNGNNNNLTNNNNSNPFSSNINLTNNNNSNPFSSNNFQNNVSSNTFNSNNYQNNVSSNPFDNNNAQNNNNSNPFSNNNLQNNNNIFNNNNININNNNNVFNNNTSQNNNNNNNNNIFNNFNNNNNNKFNIFGVNNNNNSNNNFINNSNNNVFLNNTPSNNSNNIFNNINNNDSNQNNNPNPNIVIPGFLNNNAINNVFEKSLDEKFKDPTWFKQNVKIYEPPNFIEQVEEIAKLNLEMRKMQYLSEKENQRNKNRNILYDLSFDRIILPSDETVENFYKNKKNDENIKKENNYKIENNYNNKKNYFWDPLSSFFKRSGGQNNDNKNQNINKYDNEQNINTSSKQNEVSREYNNNDLYNNVYSITFNGNDNKIQEDENLFNNEFHGNNNKTSNSSNSKFVNSFSFCPQNINNNFDVNLKFVYLGEYELIKNKNPIIHKFTTNFDYQNNEYFISLDLILKTIKEKISEIGNISKKIILPSLNDIIIITNTRTFSKTTNQEKIYLKYFQKNDDNFYLVNYTFPLKKYPLIDANYEIKPNIDEILKGDVNHVKNFEISNEFGKVVFHDDVDLSGPIKINDIILIKNEEVDLNHPRVNKLRATVFLKFEIDDKYFQGQFLENVKEFLKSNKGNYIKFENNILIYGVNNPS